MEYIIRNKSLITGKENLEHLYTFKDYPVFFGCVDSELKNDLKADMSWSICPESGIIQIDKLLPLDILYQEQHVDGVGKTWEQYYKDFALYISKNSSGNLLEIGGGMGKLAKEVLKDDKIKDYTIIEPNPIIEKNNRLNIVKGFFDGNTKIDRKINTVIFSQVLEHIYEPNEFLDNIFSFLEKGDKLIFAYPNLEKWLKNKFTNAINFEHCMFLTDYFVDIILQKNGFEIIDKTFYKDHSIFYTCVKNQKVENVKYENKYEEYKKIFMDYVDSYEELIKSFNERIEKFDGEVYLFGAHIFSQHLLVCGLDTSKIVGILDNSDLKNGKRLYGTPFKVFKPNIIKKVKGGGNCYIKSLNIPKGNKKTTTGNKTGYGNSRIAIILKAGVHQENIRKQLLEINPNIEIWE